MISVPLGTRPGLTVLVTIACRGWTQSPGGGGGPSVEFVFSGSLSWAYGRSGQRCSVEAQRLVFAELRPSR